jgi:hypothetical protein
MSRPSNLYAEKIFSEHPVAMWALDEQADYVSIIDEDFRLLSDSSNWTITNGTMEDTVSGPLQSPFPDSHTCLSTTDHEDDSITILSDFVPNIFSVSGGILSFDDLNKDLGTLCIGMYVYSQSENTTGYEIGYSYFDSVSAESVEVTKSFDIETYGKWLHISATFPILDQDVSFKLLFRSKFKQSIVTPTPHTVLYNGLTLGQWSEEFCSTSLGSDVIDIPEEIGFLPEGYKAIEARSYSREDIPGYYLVSGSSIYAKNSGIPLVYGAENSTVIYENLNETEAPSLIVPGLGFLNGNGRYQTMTAEMWLNINSSTFELKRIFGPVFSTDGLYVDGAFLGLKIGNSYSSHYVGEWARPMLVHIRYSESAASLLINGEEVINLVFDQSTINFPDPEVEGVSTDWLGFYAHEHISPILVDCVAIYGYKVPPVVAKRRFVYGQGVEFPENINNAYSGTTTFFDYSFSKYSNNYSYPGAGSWTQGVYNNLDLQKNYLATKSYEKPQLIFDTFGRDIYQEWKQDSLEVTQETSPFFSLKPNSNWNGLNGYIYFDKYQMIDEPVAAFYGIFKVSQLTSSEQVLFRIDDKLQDRYFEIVLVNNIIKYNFKDSNASIETLYQTESVIPGEQFTIGISVKDFVSYFEGNMRPFFGNPSQLSMSVGGRSELSSTFSGKIYSISILNAQSLLTVPYMFSARGIPVDYEYGFDEYDSFVLYDAGDEYFGNDGSYWQHILDGGTPTSFITARALGHTGTYTLRAKEVFDNFDLCVSTSSTWEDYLPLSYFARYVTNEKGKSYYDLDFIQFNIDYPAPNKFSKIDTQGGQWTYGDLYEEYSLPTKKTYEVLSNQLFTGYDNYADLAQRSSFEYVYDTAEAMVKTYVMFSYTSSLKGTLSGKYSNTVSLPKSGIVVPGDDWLTTRYEVVDNSIIYPPAGVNVNQIVMTTQVEIVNPDTETYPIAIRSIQYSPQSLEKSSPTAIGTRFGIDVAPYTQNGFYVDYAANNPFSVYKGSTPYLYNTRYSGVQPRGVFSPLTNRGVSIPVNPEKTRNYEIIAMQISLRFDEDFFPISPIQIFEVQGRRDHIKFFLVSTSPNGKRAKIYAVNAKTGQLDANVGLYINGKISKDATLTVKEWATLGVSFSKILDVSLTAGSIRINGPILANNISYYQSTSLEERQDTQERDWEDVLQNGTIELEWDFWDSFIWNDVLVLTSTSLFGVSPVEIYKAFTGTNRIVVDDYSATAQGQPDKLVFKDYQYSVYSDISWFSTTRSAL